jgi:Helix-turn-helix domain
LADSARDFFGGQVTPNPWHWIVDENWPANEKLVALVIKRHANAEGWAWPSPERIARLSGLSRATVFRALRWLEDKSAVETKIERGIKKYRLTQQQGLLFSSANSLWESCEKAEDDRLTQRLQSLPLRREVRTTREDRKPLPLRAQTARGNLWKLDAKARRILREIALLQEANIGAGPEVIRPGSEPRANTIEQKIAGLYAELERIGCKFEKAG